MSHINDNAQIDFVTMGMFILDQIHFGEEDGRPMIDDVVGGAGTYAVLGARLFCETKNSDEEGPKRVAWIVDAGSDFPNGVEEELQSWDTTLILRRNNDRKTTRGWNSYSERETRAFKYLTPKLRLEPEDILSYPPLLSSRCFHIISSPTRADSIVSSLLTARAAADGHFGHLHMPPPMFLWEPVPDLCVPEHLGACLCTLKSIDIVSPNASELASFFGKELEKDVMASKDLIEELGRQWIDAGVKVGVIVRVGKNGCVVIRRRESSKNRCEIAWLPAYYSKECADIKLREDKGVVDPTGGGNAFMGGLAIGHLRTGNLITAACFGNIAASFAIEQIGMPKVHCESRDAAEELWNDVKVKERLNRYLEKVKKSGVISS